MAFLFDITFTRSMSECLLSRSCKASRTASLLPSLFHTDGGKVRFQSNFTRRRVWVSIAFISSVHYKNWRVWFGHKEQLQGMDCGRRLFYGRFDLRMGYPWDEDWFWDGMDGMT